MKFCMCKSVSVLLPGSSTEVDSVWPRREEASVKPHYGLGGHVSAVRVLDI